MVYVELDTAFRVIRAVTGSETVANAIGRYMTPERVIDVVRCGECKHMMPDGRCREFADLYVRPSVSDFCSYGERREDGES